VGTDAIQHDQIDQISYWQPEGVNTFVAASGHNYVGLMKDGRTVLRHPFCKTHETLQSLRDEADRYIRLGAHENLAAYKGFGQDGLLLEYCEGGTLLDAIEGPIEMIDDQKRFIAIQIVRCLVYLHQHNFIYCDVHVRNVFLTSDMVAKV
jgi:serine/threonine protein kinase